MNTTHKTPHTPHIATTTDTHTKTKPSTSPGTILVISLERSLQRRKIMDFQLQRLQLPFSFIDAVDGKLLSQHTRTCVEAQRDPTIYRKPFTAGEIGCMHSHINAYRRIFEHKIPYALILEDDVFLSEQVADFLSADVHAALATSKAKDWDIILLAYVQRGNVESRPTLPAQLSFWHRQCLPRKFMIGKPVQFCYHAAAYLVSLKGAEKLLSLGIPLRMPADILTGNAQKYGLELYCTSRPIIRQHHEWALHSTIKEDKQDSEYAYVLKTSKLTHFSFVLRKIHHHFMRILSYAWNATLLAIRGHANIIIVFLRKLGILPPDSI